MQTIQNLSPRVLLVVMDGFGLTQNDFKNAIKAAKKPNLDDAFNLYTLSTIQPGG